jgi:branched-chain amino acid transport system permease protein
MITGNLKASYAADEQLLDNNWKRGFLLACILGLGWIAAFGSDYVILIACQMGIALLAVIGVNVVIGYTGLMSLGHAAFMAVGAYVAVILHNALADMIPEAMLTLVVLPATVAITAIIGIIVGLPSLRVKGLYLAVATLSANFIVIFLIELEAFSSVTGGMVGINTPTPNLLGWQIDTRREQFILIAALAIIGLFLVQNLFRTRIGRAFIAIRDRDYSAEILGIPLYRYKLMSFAISAAYCGLAGVLFAYFYARILPEQFELALSLMLVAAIIVGGMGRMMGPVFGVIVIVMVPEAIKVLFGTFSDGSAETAQILAPIQEIAFGLLIVVFILFEPFGLNHIADRALRALNRWPFARG